MAIQAPPSVNYPSPLVSIPDYYNRTPSEGPRMIPVEIEWANMGGANNCVNISLWGNAPQTLSQVCTISVDNSRCGSDVVFQFPDTNRIWTIPAYTDAIFPVFTGATNFWVYALQELGANDPGVTNFGIHNTVPPPVAIPRSELQQTSGTAGIPASGAGQSQLIGPTKSGTLESIMVMITASAPAAAVSFNWNIQDGAGNTLVTGAYAVASGTSGTQLLVNLQDIAWRFKNGLVFNILAGGSYSAAVGINPTVFYRSP